jgi:poly-gamma-glutamate synthesis protein (capsule biosynthesis protein)
MSIGGGKSFMVKAGLASFVGAILALAVAAPTAQAHTKTPRPRRSEITIVLTGQSLMDTDVRTAQEALKATAPLLKGDVVFTNFETTVREPGASAAEMDPVSGIYAPPTAMDALKEMGFNLLSMANNHIYDIGEVGLVATDRAATARGIAHSGIGRNLDDATQAAFLHTSKGVVALVSVATGFLNGRGRAGPNKPGLNELAHEGGDLSATGGPVQSDADRNLAAIREARSKADVVIVSHHNHVYDRPFTDLMLQRSPDRLRPPRWVQAWAHREIDAGADMIVMHGAPFFQAVEIYRGKPILYDVGNYIFQLKHAEHIPLFGEVAGESAIVHTTFAGRHLMSMSLHPIVLNPRARGTDEVSMASRGIPRPAPAAQGRTILQRIVDLSQEFGTQIRINGDSAELVVQPSAAPH